MEYPYLMNKRSCRYVPNLPEIQKQYGADLVPITAEQALALDAEGKSAGVKILRAIVAADNAAALAEVEAGLEPEPAPAPAPAEEAEKPVELKDLPLPELRDKAKKLNEGDALPDGTDIGKMSRKELLAFLKNFE